VDNSIVREPGTRLPKIPGTALHGAIRQYAAYRYKNLDCAGGGKNHNNNCPVCYTFGHIKEAGSDGGQSGRVSIGDARLLLFPAYSLAGTVWVTCPAVLREFGVKEADPGDRVRLPQNLSNHDHLNLGWLMLPKAENVFNWPDKINDVPDEIKSRAALVSDKLFSQIVNSNLEVRTSVSINPETGAAADKALFTYEAIPRAAILWFDVVEDDFSGKFPQDNDKAQKSGHKRPLDVVTAGLELVAMLGAGGMGTRGFGRIQTVAHREVKNDQP